MTAPRPHPNYRLRKNLHLKAFSDLGFSISAGPSPGWTDVQREQAVIGLICEVEYHALCYGGGDSDSGLDAYIARRSRTRSSRLASAKSRSQR